MSEMFKVTRTEVTYVPADTAEDAVEKAMETSTDWLSTEVSAEHLISWGTATQRVMSQLDHLDTAHIRREV